ncbi:MAG: ATP-binding protein, partial [Verrucomicrobia bacterium]|nr:ATP-binding protein [Verrucomicrobiota bacterium]
MNPNHWEDARWNVFTSKTGGEAFGSIAYPQDVWSNDPYDEESIHAEARQVFSDLIEVAADGARGERRGRIFLLQGNAGSGKTHLMGAFRREVERRSAGYFAYAQMSTELPLRKYLLRRIIDCLDRFGALDGSSGLMRLSDRLVEWPGIPPAEREALRNHEDYSEPLRSIRARLLDDLKRSGASKTLHGDFVTALLALQRRDGNAVSAATKYLRGDPLGVEDLRWLCSPHGLSGIGEPEILLDWLLRAVREFGSTQGSAFVLCIDQLEDLYDLNAPQQQRFPELVSILRSLVENHPGLVVVVACLEDYYSTLRAHLKHSDIDRLENNPKPGWLKTERTAEEVVALVRKRLEVLYADSGVSAGTDEDRLSPFSRQELAKLQGLRPRAILDACYEAWKGSRCTGELPRIKVPAEPPIGSPPPASPAEVDWSHKWNDFRTSWDEPVPRSAGDLAESLAAGVNTLAEQLRVSLHADHSADLVHLSVTSDALIAAI